MYVINIQTKTLSAICSFPKWTYLSWCLKLKSNLHVEPFSNCALPHRALTCTIIQGGMDSNCPLMKVVHASSREGNQGAEWESQVGQQLAAKRLGSKQNKEILLRAWGWYYSHCPGTEGCYQDTGTLTSAFITPWVERGVGAHRLRHLWDD